MKKVVLASILVPIVLLPFVVTFSVSLTQKNKYTESYYAALIDKYNRLESIKGKKKIIVVGGSNVAFGLDSLKLKEYFPDYEVQNFGLYGALGTKVMMDLSLNNISKGDIVILAPEVSAQSMSLYFNGDAFLKATEERKELFFNLPFDNQKQVIGSYFGFIKERSKLNQPVSLDKNTVYRRSKFNEYGDISYMEELDGEIVSFRNSNIMNLGYDSNNKVKINKSIISSDFISYANKYANKIKDKGAEIYFDYSPINSLSVIQPSRDESAIYQEYLQDNLVFPVIGNIRDYIIQSDYFYDTNFHMNDTGALYRTILLIRDLYTQYGKADKIESFPQPPVKHDYEYKETEEDIINQKYFTYEEVDNGVIITGLSDQVTDNKELRFPGFINHKRVLRYEYRSEVKNDTIVRLIIPECKIEIANKFFDNFTKLSRVDILEKSPTNISVGVDLIGDKDDFRFYVPIGSYYSYITDYYWMNYSWMISTDSGWF